MLSVLCRSAYIHLCCHVHIQVPIHIHVFMTSHITSTHTGVYKLAHKGKRTHKYNHVRYVGMYVGVRVYPVTFVHVYTRYTHQKV